MRNKRIQPEQLAETIAQGLKEYNEKVNELLQKEIQTVTKSAVKELKAGSPRKTGKYARGWTQKTMHKSKTDIRIAIHNPKRYRLTHLLEKGHRKVNGGSVRAIPHIGPVEQSTIKQLNGKVKVIVKG